MCFNPFQMYLKSLAFLIVLFFSLVGCFSQKASIRYHEAEMPFINMGTTGERLFPIQFNDDESTFRVSFNIGSSIDRIITINFDSLDSYSGTLFEQGYVFNEQGEKIEHFKKISIEPKSGFQNFFSRLDSLDLLEMNNREEISIVLHQSFSVNFVEYKNEGQYNQFYFYTQFPHEEKDDSDFYNRVQSFIIEEFEEYLPLK